MLRVWLRSAIAKSGYEVTRVPEAEPMTGIASIESLVERFEYVPGMLDWSNAGLLYLLSRTSSVRGDVVELGSWQGRSTCFLAQGCRDSGNGVVHAVDHFKGNTGRESHYVVGKEDLSDLKSNFETNIARAGLSDRVVLHDMSSQDARSEVSSPVRLLFIDAEHTYSAVTNDISVWRDVLTPGAIVVFDDVATSFPGVVKAVREGFEGFTAPVTWGRFAFMTREL